MYSLLSAVRVSAVFGWVDAYSRASCLAADSSCTHARGMTTAGDAETVRAAINYCSGHSCTFCEART